MEKKKFSKNLHVKPTFRHCFKPFILVIQLRKNNNKKKTITLQASTDQEICAFLFLPKKTDY